jgi:hypothetical protein
LESYFCGVSVGLKFEGKNCTVQCNPSCTFESGSLNVQYGRRKKRFQSHKNSDAVFYLSAFTEEGTEMS